MKTFKWVYLGGALFALCAGWLRHETRALDHVPVAIAKFAEVHEILYTQMAAAAALSILPALVLLIIGQRNTVAGLTQGARK
jgi:ABC-type maltose transport system permease subunit